MERRRYLPVPTLTPWKRDDKQLLLSTGYGGRKMYNQYFTPPPPSTLEEQEFTLVRGGPAVVIMAVTREGHALVCEEYKQGSHDLSFENPAGMVDSKQGETPDQAARRELREETGYDTERQNLISLGQPVEPQRRFLADSPLYLYLAVGCYQIGAQELDENEFIKLHQIPVLDWVLGVHNGETSCVATSTCVLRAIPHLIARGILDMRTYSAQLGELVTT